MWSPGWAPAEGPRPAWAVTDSPDFQRIKALPMLSPAETKAMGEALVPEMSELLRREGSNALLKWPQALALDWIYKYRGAYLGLPPGVGKTLITMLAPVVLDSSAPCLIAPATLHRNKTPDDFARYQRDWTPHYKGPTLLNLEAMSLDQNLFLLDKGKFDLVMVDECDLLRNPDAASFVRLDRYRMAAPNAAFVFLTGSGMRFGIEDYDLHMCWCLPNGQAPVPYNQDEREMWREALRARPKGRPNNASRRPRAGVLLDLCALPHMPKDELPRTELETAQIIVGRRINATPGVLIIDDDDCDQPMTIRLVKAPEDPTIDADFDRFYGTSIEALDERGEDDEDAPPPAYCLPEPGQPCTNGLEVWQALRSLGCGYFTYPDPPPPLEYVVKRRRYARAIRSLIEQSVWSSDPADTPGAAKRRFPNEPAVLEWEAVQRKPFPPLNKPFKANMVLMQRSDSVVRFAVQWMKENEGLVWCASVPLAKWIAKAAGVRYYGAEGKAADGALLNEYTPSTERAVVSIKANSRGRNLQGNFNRGLVIQLPQSADECHQLFKRYHRFGQTKPVYWDVLITSGAAEYSFDMALYEARGVKKQRRQTQTILHAEIVRCILDSNNPRWFRKPAPK
jgi:hypothetical protein